MGKRLAGGAEFLITLGLSPEDCMNKLTFAMSDYREEDMKDILWCWQEQWMAGEEPGKGFWQPAREIPYQSIFMRVANVKS